MVFLARVSTLLCLISLLCQTSAGWAQEAEIGPVGTGLADSIGLNQNVVVVLCQYQNDNTPFQVDDPTSSVTGDLLEVESAAQFVQFLEDPINDYFLAATRQSGTGQGVTSFQFVPIPGLCQLSFVNNGQRDDPSTMENELYEGAIFADRVQPGIFNSNTRIMVVVNGDKRARAAWAGMPFDLPNAGLKMLRSAVVERPKSRKPISARLHTNSGISLAYRSLPTRRSLGRSRRAMGRDGKGSEATFHGLFEIYGQLDRGSGRTGYYDHPVNTARRDDPVGRSGKRQWQSELIRLDASGVEASPLAGPLSDAIGQYAPFIGYYIEFRNPAVTPLDAPIVASGYRRGMLVFRHTDWLNTETGYSPRPLTVMHPTSPSPVPDASTASFPPGVPFVDPTLGLVVTPGPLNPDGSIDVTISWAPPPRPDIVVADLRLDSPVNGIGSFVDPLLFGDPVMSATTMTLSTQPPSVSTVIPPHMMRITFANLGTGANPPV